MSKAFQDKWNRLSANRRLLAVIVHIAKRGPIHINQDDIEMLASDAGIVQSFEGNDIVLTYVPPDTKVFFLGTDNAVQRAPQLWAESSETTTATPPRLREMMDEMGLGGPASTLDDQRMMEREVGIAKAQEIAARARASRQPLPVPTPAYPPAK